MKIIFWFIKNMSQYCVCDDVITLTKTGKFLLASTIIFWVCIPLTFGYLIVGSYYLKTKK